MQFKLLLNLITTHDVANSICSIQHVTYTTDIFQQMGNVALKLLHSLLQTIYNIASSTWTIFMNYFDTAHTHCQLLFYQPVFPHTPRSLEVPNVALMETFVDCSIMSFTSQKTNGVKTT